MAITGCTNLGNDRCVLTVDHDPTQVATEAPKGSLIIRVSDGAWFRKTDDGSSTNVQRAGLAIGTLISCGGESEPFFDTSLESYEVVHKFPFPGVTQVGKPTTVYYVLERTSTGGQTWCRIWDDTNGQLISEVTLNTGPDDTVILVTDSSPGNWPDAQAVFSLELKHISSGLGRVYSVVIV